MRIGITTHNYPPHPGGLEVIVGELARGFARQHEVTVVSTAWEGRRGIANENGATIHRLPAWHGAERRGVPYATPLGPGTRKAFSALRGCDVLHAHGSLYSTTLLALWARRRGVPLFVTEHVGLVHYSAEVFNLAQRAAWSLIGGPVVRRSAKVITYNSRVRGWLEARFGGDGVAFIPNGVDTDTFRPRSIEERRAARAALGLPPDEALALFVGREAKKKNLNAVMRFPADGYRLVTCGAERDLPSEILDLGVVSHGAMHEIFGAADFMLHAATGEGFPVAIQEAMASGLPVAVLWDSGYEGSVERDAVSAVDSLDGLAALATTLAADTELRRTLGEVSRRYALRNWSWETTVERHLRLFASAMREDS